MILVRFPSTRYLANKVSMPFLIRPSRRVLVDLQIFYQPWPVDQSAKIKRTPSHSAALRSCFHIACS